MKRCAGLIILCVSLFCKAQNGPANFSTIDWNVQSIKPASPDSLAFALTAFYTTDLEKVRAIYTWICQNIKYNTDIYKPLALRAKFIPEPLDTTAWGSADEMVAKKVLRRGVAVCDGYSRLFKVLCQYAGVEAVVLNGYARSDVNRSRDYFKTNHTWNAVRIDSAWHLIDATWGAGFVTYGDEFVQKQNDFYFLTPPREFVRDHYPEELRWTLLPEPPSLAEFKRAPFKSKFFVKYGITGYSPAQGLVETEVGDTLRFAINLQDVKKAKSVFPDPFFDSASVSLSPASIFLHPEKEDGNTVSYQFVVDDSTQWVHLLFNDDVVLRYAVNRKRSIASK